MRIEELKELEARATKRPWWYFNEDDSHCMNMDALCHEGGGEPEDETDLRRCVAVGLVQVPSTFYCQNCEQDFRFISALRNAAPHLIAVVEAAKLVQIRISETNRPPSLQSRLRTREEAAAWVNEAISGMHNALAALEAAQ